MTGLVVDTSSAVAILTGEQGRDELMERMAAAERRLISAGTLIELGFARTDVEVARPSNGT